MDGIGSDLWVCAGCRSINKLRAKQCYNCRTPRDRAAVDPRTIDPSTTGALRAIDLPAFESTRPYAIAASVFILAITGMQVLGVIVSARLVLGVLGGGGVTEGDILVAGLFGLATLVVGVLALAAWAAWLSKAVTAMPALGLGYPPGNGLTAFVESFVPGLNLFRVPAIVRDIVRRLSPEEGRGDAFIFVAWIGLFGGLFVPRVGRWFGFFAADTMEATIRNELIVEVIAVALVLIGAIFLVALIWWIQERIDERRAAQLAEAGGTTGTPMAPVPAAEASSGTTLDAAGGASTVDGAAVAEPAPAEGSLAATPVAEPAPSVVERAATLESPPVATAPAAAPPPVASSPVASSHVASSHVASSPEAPAPAAPAPGTSAPPPARPITSVAPRVPDPAGPRLTIRIVGGRMTGSVDDEPDEPIDLDELRTAAPALARAGGNATVLAAGSEADLTGRVVDLLRTHGIDPEVRAL